MSAAVWRAVVLGLVILVPAVVGLAGDTNAPAPPSDPASAMPTLETCTSGC